MTRTRPWTRARTIYLCVGIALVILGVVLIWG